MTAGGPGRGLGSSDRQACQEIRDNESYITDLEVEMASHYKGTQYQQPGIPGGSQK